MNYLAHQYLSFGDEEIMVGNYIADAIKGNQVKQYAGKILEGIKLHRNIDTFTDQHPLVCQSKERIRKRYRKYAGVVVDMYYDHYLAAGWKNYSDVPLQQFTKNTYRTLFKYYLLMPGKMKRILPAMAIGNWLASYTEVDNIGLALKGMSLRTRFDSGIENGRDELLAYYPELQNDFEAFFPDVIAYAKNIMSNQEKDSFAKV